jgi:exosortase/archaeosortase family protein
LLILAVGLVVIQKFYRTAEITLAAGILRVLVGSGVDTAPERQVVYFGLDTDHPIGLKMTPECTSAFLVLPLIVVGAAMVALRPWIGRRVLIALGVGAAALIIVNQLRVLLMVGLVASLGIDRGYYWGHTMLGSMVSVFGGAAALVLFVWLATRNSKVERTAAKRVRAHYDEHDDYVDDDYDDPRPGGGYTGGRRGRY